MHVLTINGCEWLTMRSGEPEYNARVWVCLAPGGLALLMLDDRH